MAFFSSTNLIVSLGRSWYNLLVAPPYCEDVRWQRCNAQVLSGVQYKYHVYAPYPQLDHSHSHFIHIRLIRHLHFFSPLHQYSTGFVFKHSQLLKMKFSIALGALAQVASAHYFFDTTIVAGVTSRSNEYIRASTRAVAYNPIKFSSNPPADIRDNSMFDKGDGICNQGAFKNAGKTKVLTIAAGQELTVKLGVNAKMEHPGPGLAYMSRAPNDNVVAYDGTGDWFKIYQEGVCTKGDFTKDAWCTWGRNTLTAKIPAGTPSGEYLVRFEHIGVHRSHVNQPEHFVSCVQVKVTNGGNGVPGPLVKFPAAYSAKDPYANFNVYGGAKEFPFPGPKVWDGAGSATTAPYTGSSTGSGSPAASSSKAPSQGTAVTPATKPAASSPQKCEWKYVCPVERRL